MRVVFQSNSWVQLGFVLALLRDAGLGPVELDTHVSAIEGNIGAFPRRIVVADDEERQALRVLREAGEIA
ncbi:MAG: DUF2007 domain-containing protein [Acetobacteraceae bacterium]|nr:DUF2007 domain-containing protein [Acetobacteraceae bacterium]